MKFKIGDGVIVDSDSERAFENGWTGVVTEVVPGYAVMVDVTEASARMYTRPIAYEEQELRLLTKLHKALK